MPIMPNGFNGGLFAAKYKLVSSDFWAVGNELICPPLPNLTEADIADCVDLVTPIINAVQLHLDATAQARGYDSMLTCVSYVASLMSIWSAEGQAACDWRDACWDKTHQIINSGGVLPTPDQVVAQLPVMVWP